MNRSITMGLLGFLMLAAPGRSAEAAPPADSAMADLAGTWAGTVTHEDEAESIALDLEAGADGRFTIRLSMPVAHLERVPLGRIEAIAVDDSVQLGPFRFQRDRSTSTLHGTLPHGFVPVYEIPMELRKTDRFVAPARAPLAAPVREPAWTFEAGSPLWAGPTFADGAVYVGAQNGTLFALDARTGTKRWSFQAGGAIRTRPTITNGALYVQADDGFLYALDPADGTTRWRVKIVESPIERLPFDNPKSRYDRFGSDVAVAGGRLYVGTHDGKLMALAPADGKVLWSFSAGAAVLAAPGVANGRVYFGSYDHFVYALSAADGRLLWKRDTQGAVVSTPALDGDRVIVGNRCYDLLALDAESGNVSWKRYIWMSWIESSATIRDGVIYVGSSDAAAVFAFDVRSGRRVWTADVFGWAWGQPSVTKTRVYAGTSGQVGYPVPHGGSVLALDRATGRPVWRFTSTPPDSGAFGFPGSPAVGAELVFASGLDGRVYAFRE